MCYCQAAGDTKVKKDFASNPFPLFHEWYYTKILSTWPNFDHASVLIKTTSENLFTLINDINLLTKGNL